VGVNVRVKQLANTRFVSLEVDLLAIPFAHGRPQRLRMIRGLDDAVTLLIAADEFQCLDGGLRPNPLAAWLPTSMSAGGS